MTSTAVERIPPELSTDIFDRGIILTGGGSLFNNLDKRQPEETGRRSSSRMIPPSSVVLGAGKMLSDFNLRRRISLLRLLDRRFASLDIVLVRCGRRTTNSFVARRQHRIARHIGCSVLLTRGPFFVKRRQE